MNTPIHDFVTRYKDLRPARFHMPGHKGRGPLGCEDLDLTEIPGADSLYEADGIIAESEANASRLFGCPTFYSTEGSSHCIRAMLYAAREACQGIRENAAFRVLAARNVHKAFLTAAALLDIDVCWLPLSEGSYLSAQPTPETLAAALEETGAKAVYLTCPDYLGFLPDLQPLAELCRANGALLLVDNAHGAYLRFLTPSRHPMDLGAALCCDSAHKTLPVLTGGAYLHVKGSRPKEPGTGNGSLAPPDMTEHERRAVRDALALFGSTSPSYLILQSLDLANPRMERLPEKLAAFLPRAEALKARLRAAGWRLVGDEPLKLTLALGPRSDPSPGKAPACPPSGVALAALLEQSGVFCEFADPDHIVFMLSPEHTVEELARLETALLNARRKLPDRAAEVPGCDVFAPRSGTMPRRVCSIRQAMLAPAIPVPAAESLGRVLARPGVSCPPAVPILMPGERIDRAAVEAFRYYGIRSVSVLP